MDGFYGVSDKSRQIYMTIMATTNFPIVEALVIINLSSSIFSLASYSLPIHKAYRGNPSSPDTSLYVSMR